LGDQPPRRRGHEPADHRAGRAGVLRLALAGGSQGGLNATPGRAPRGAWPRWLRFTFARHTRRFDRDGGNMKRIVLAGCLGLLCGGHADASLMPIDLAAPAATTEVTLNRVRRDGAPQAIDGFTLQRFTFEAAASPTLTVTPANPLAAGDE